MAESAGFGRLGNAVDVLGRYQGLVGAARRSWAQANAEKLIGFIRAYRGGLDWLYVRANRAEALAILQRNVRGMPPELSPKPNAVLLAAEAGFHPAPPAAEDGTRTVFSPRRRN